MSMLDKHGIMPPKVVCFPSFAGLGRESFVGSFNYLDNPDNPVDSLCRYSFWCP